MNANPSSSRPNAALRHIVQHASANDPHYRRLFEESGLDPRDVRTTGDLAALPVTTKADIQREPAAFIARGVDSARLLVRVTSGSSGQPVAIRNSPYDEFRRQRMRWRVDLGYGIRPGDRRVRFRTPRPLLAGDRMLLAVLSASRLYAQTKVDSRLPGDEALAILEAFRPTMIDGMTNTIDRAAAVALDRGRTTARPRFVTTGGETLTPEARCRIREAFKAPVFDIFGSCEFGVIASECPETGLYHVSTGVALEIVTTGGRPARDGEYGEVVATSLLSRAVPVVRYASGDLAVRGPDGCPCGARVETLREVCGRVVEVFSLRDGRQIHPWHLPMRTTTWIRTFQFVQEAGDSFVLRLVPSPDASPNDFDDLRNEVSRLLGPKARLEIDVVERLEIEPGGKQRPFVPLGVGSGPRIDSGVDPAHSE